MLIKIAPSILSADFSKLGEEVLRIERAGADLVHIDVMDGHFVPNITIGPPVVKSLKKVSNLPFEVHLMIENPDMYIESFADAGADIISVHAESCCHLHRTIQKIKQLGKKAVVALNPATSLCTVEWVLEDVDMILLMSVNPGFGGQKYISGVTRKIEELKRIIDSRGLHIDIEVDGGIDTENIHSVTKAGANVIVSGSTIFAAEDTVKIIQELRMNSYRE
ncbi:ribulose-phosphate 3-epimerase [Acetivibrio straminisolvens]|jgi:ribulose-phosphate 3-epimerase|uniref:Ribulose-phosphate 3-epimerase n=1 Tax=Acetivibrio straminisolvens JCM 21531 TaxID=1294263 RepID=W4V174_9FIRM|nr:ribulose-phosphate 3-epimerase [Acetivibrio straminisolvens]GAE86852.1 ribulose-phosphate 3-epimerase [Acetivibrio straminisolvens JCM 21531]